MGRLVYLELSQTMIKFTAKSTSYYVLEFCVRLFSSIGRLTLANDSQLHYTSFQQGSFHSTLAKMQALSQGKVKSVLSGDTLVLVSLNAPSQERMLNLAFVSAPRLRREGDEVRQHISKTIEKVR